MNASPARSVPLEDIASCFEGIVPATICSCSAQGISNLTFLSVVQLIDSQHVGLSYQFFNKTRRNILENPRVQVVVISPETFIQYRLHLSYERTDTAGAAFDRMKTRLDAVASQAGMSQVFKLRGVDIYRVLDCHALDFAPSPEPASRVDYLPALEAFSERLAGCSDLESLLRTALDAWSALFGYDHSFVMVPDEEARSLYTIASRGFEISGVGSEVSIGEGILGIAAERRKPVRTTSFTRDRLYSRAIRSTIESRGQESTLEREIPLPGLPGVQSQLVAPLVAQNELLGVVCLQSTAVGCFRAEDEQVLQIAARHLAACMAALGATESAVQPAEFPPSPPAVSAAASVVKHYAADDSIFIDDAYLIKGVAGRVFWKLLQEHARSGRVDFTNKEIRLDASLQLPGIKDNLEARLILLRRRLEDRCDFARLLQARRGQFHLELQRRLRLEEYS